MKKSYLHLIWLLALLALPMLGHAQYEFKTVTPVPYQQDFNLLSGTRSFANNTTLPGVYAQADFGTDYNPTVFMANNGSNTEANYYHFGSLDPASSSDRSFGGIAGTSFTSGIGYVGVRLKNTTGRYIRSLDIKYAMEQWYNSGRVDKARVAVGYLVAPVGRTVTGLTNRAGAWTDIPSLAVDAPSTAGVISNRDGNSPSNRRVQQATLTNINLAPNQEIMIRWGYVLNSTTNGNGLSIDDILITPQVESNIYYLLASTTSKLDDIRSWNSKLDGTGTAPRDFNGDGMVLYVTNKVDGTRLNGTLNLSGKNSKIVIGQGTATGSLTIASGKNISGMVEVAAGSTLRVETNTPALTLNAVAPTSIVEYANTSSQTQTVLGTTYGTLRLIGAGSKVLNGDVIVNSTLALDNSKVTLNNNDLTVLRGGTVTNTGTNAYVQTNDEGSLQQTVKSDNVKVLYPVGNSTYNPVWLQQSQAQSEDVFGVVVSDNLFASYENGKVKAKDKKRKGVGTPVVNRVISRTWFIDEEVKGNSNLTVTFQWENTAATSGFVASATQVNHYENDKWDSSAQTAAKVVATNVFQATRTGIKSFSPFGVSSGPGGVLPVQLVSFTAARAAASVRCNWKTASELNNDHFTVERSADGKKFNAIGTVAGLGTSAVGRAYTFVDAKPLPGTAYYRLQQQDTDGTSTYSAVIAVAGSLGQTEVTIFPNPGTGHFQVLGFPTEIKQTATVRNILGAQVQTVASDGTLDLSAQPAGVYLLQLQTASGLQTKRIVKQ
jgi:hypothetical protein